MRRYCVHVFTYISYAEHTGMCRRCGAPQRNASNTQVLERLQDVSEEVRVCVCVESRAHTSERMSCGVLVHSIVPNVRCVGEDAGITASNMHKSNESPSTYPLTKLEFKCRCVRLHFFLNAHVHRNRSHSHLNAALLVYTALLPKTFKHV